MTNSNAHEWAKVMAKRYWVSDEDLQDFRQALTGMGITDKQVTDGHIRMVMLAHGLLCEKVSEEWEHRERCSRGQHLTLVDTDREDI
jgi:hypothetical protein